MKVDKPLSVSAWNAHWQYLRPRLWYKNRFADQQPRNNLIMYRRGKSQQSMCHKQTIGKGKTPGEWASMSPGKKFSLWNYIQFQHLLSTNCVPGSMFIKINKIQVLPSGSWVLAQSHPIWVYILLLPLISWVTRGNLVTLFESPDFLIWKQYLSQRTAVRLNERKYVIWTVPVFHKQ